MNRRIFMASGLGLLGALAATSCLYLGNEPMERAPAISGKLLFDAHAHPSSTMDDKSTLEMICSPGIVGLAYINEDTVRGKILTYEEALNRFSGNASEIDRGMLARISTDYGTGYFTRTQEITGGGYADGPHHPHILAVGFKGDYLENHKDARKTIDEIHKKGGIAIINHPYITHNESGLVKYRMINPKEEKILSELLLIADEVEVFNANSINPTLGILVENMKEANKLAEKLVEGTRFKGTASSDAHYRMDQPKICGIYIDSAEEPTIEKIKHSIKSGQFESSCNYVSRWSFLRGMFKF